MISGVPHRTDDAFDETVRHFTEIFDDRTDARDIWRSACSLMEAVRRDADPDRAVVRPVAFGFADATVRVLRSATLLGIAASEAEQLVVAVGADMTAMGDPRVAWLMVASAAIVAALRDFGAERSTGDRGQA